jgi:hypothetical protein
MSGQSWSKREAPWGSRRGYVGGALGDISKVGPGMDTTKVERERVGAGAIEAERAALCGYTSVEGYREGQGARAGPRSTREASGMETAARGFTSHGRRQATDDNGAEAKRARTGASDAKAQSGWYYVDPSGAEHGPFDTDQMLLWYGDDEGAGGGATLPATTKVKRGRGGNLRAATTYFLRVRDGKRGWKAKLLSGQDDAGAPPSSSSVSAAAASKAAPEPTASAEDRKKNQLYVGGLQRSCGGVELRQLFAKFAEALTDAWVPGEGREGGGRGFGFVSFKSAAAATEAAAALDGVLSHGRTLRVNPARGRGRGSQKAAGELSGWDATVAAGPSSDGLHAEAPSKGSWCEMTDGHGRRKYLAVARVREGMAGLLLDVVRAH